jgi:uncharacterized protein YjbI with pentapeptide repeats
MVETGLDYSGRCLDGANLTDRLILSTTFDGASLRRANLTGTEFRECSFIGANLDAGILKRTVFENCDFTRASLTNANLQQSTFRSTTILDYGDGAHRLRPSINKFDGAVLNGSSFRRARLVAAKLHNVTGTKVDFTNCEKREFLWRATSRRRLLEMSRGRCKPSRIRQDAGQARRDHQHGTARPGTCSTFALA